jgi:plasmid stabilization system protein ParE
MEVVLLLSAERDLQEAYDWVEEHRRGREQSFLEDVELRLEHLRKFPLIGRLYRGRYRRLLIPRYPLVSSTLSSQTGLLSMPSPISGKIPKRSESAFPNNGYFTVICLMEAIFVLIKS